MSQTSPYHSLNRDTVEHISTSKGEPAWMTELRLAALAYYKSLSQEKAGPTSLHEIEAFIEPPKSSVPSEEWPRDLSAVIEERGDEEGLIVQRDSTILSKSISKEMTMKGVIYADLETTLRRHPELVKKYFAQQIKPDELFSALSTAFWSGGSFLFVPKHIHVELPFHSCYWMTTPGAAVFPRTVLVAEQGARVTLVDDFLSADWDKPSLAISAVELYLQTDARVIYKQVHHWGKGVHHVNRQMSAVDFGGRLDCAQVSDPRPVMTLEHVAELYPEKR